MPKAVVLLRVEGGLAVFGRKGRPLSWQEAALRKEGGDCCCSSGWWEPDVAEGLLPPPTGRQRASEPGAGDTATILSASLAALLDTLLAYGSSPPPWSCKHPAQRLLTLLPTGSQRRQERGVRFGHVRPAIPGGGHQAGQGHWWAPGWRREMGWTPAGFRAGGGLPVRLGWESAMGYRKTGWR